MKIIAMTVERAHQLRKECFALLMEARDRCLPLDEDCQRKRLLKLDQILFELTGELPPMLEADAPIIAGRVG